jgi:hypothetical protein
MPVSGTGAKAGESLWDHAVRSLTSSWGGLAVQAVVAGAAAYSFGQMDASWAVGMAESMKKSVNVRYAVGAVGGLLVANHFLNAFSGLSRSSNGLSDAEKAKKNEAELADVRIKITGLETRGEGPAFDKLPIAQRIDQIVNAYEDDRTVTDQEKQSLEKENARLHVLVKRVDKCPPMTSLQIATFIIEHKDNLDAKIETLTPHAKAQVKEHLEVQKLVSMVVRAGGDAAAAAAAAAASGGAAH